MKRHGHLLPLIARRDTLVPAFLRASRGRRDSPAARRFAGRLDENLNELAAGILDGSVEIGGYVEFTVFDPKRRIIRAAPFPQRVLHHAILDVCGPIFERGAIAHSYACRLGRGNRAAWHRARALTAQHRYYLKMDVRRYFDSVDHAALKVHYRRLFKDAGLLALLDRIVDSHHFTPGRGLPIGTLTSQYFANVYLDGFDRWVTETLGCAAYVRFMDDFVLWSDDRQRLESAQGAIGQWLAERLHLTLKDGTRLGNTAEGLPFLGFRVMPDGLLLGLRARRRFRTKLAAYEAAYRKGQLDESALQRHVGALVAHTDQARCRDWRRGLLLKRSEDGLPC